MVVSATDLWTAGGVLLGFQVTSFMWRIQQEANVADRGDICWLPPADIVNLAGMLVLTFGVFIGPLTGFGGPRTPGLAFGLAALLFVGHCFALAGHYELYNNRTTRSFAYFPLQEKAVFSLLILAVAGYVALAS